MSDLLVSVYLAVGALAILIYFARTPGQIHDPHEPKLVHAYIPVPFIGHLVGLYWYRTGYYTKLR